MCVDGLVFDVTNYIGVHPGGDIILESLGTDATELFSKLTRRASQLGKCKETTERQHSRTTRVTAEWLVIVSNEYILMYIFLI